MKRVKCNRPIRVGKAVYRDVYDLIHYVQTGEPNHGVYVGADRQGYPTFDSSDALYEDRSYWNFVFATSPEEVERKVHQLEQTPEENAEYWKLNVSMQPMAYWRGETSDRIRLLVNEHPWETWLRSKWQAWIPLFLEWWREENL